MIWCVEDDAGVREIELYTLRQTGFAGLLDHGEMAE